ncbi:MAG: hypothetical protein WDM88_10230 [Galbitalea sp.]
MSAVVSAVTLHLNRRRAIFLVPLWIAAVVGVISVIIALIFWRGGGQPGTADWIQSSQSNPGIVYALGSFFRVSRVSSVASTYPFALTLGLHAARVRGRHARLAGAHRRLRRRRVPRLSLIEIATHHWFLGFYAFDIYALGAGDPWRLLAIVFLGVLAFLAIGAVFAAAWLRFGLRGHSSSRSVSSSCSVSASLSSSPTSPRSSPRSNSGGSRSPRVWWWCSPRSAPGSSFAPQSFAEASALGSLPSRIPANTGR